MRLLAFQQLLVLVSIFIGIGCGSAESVDTDVQAANESQSSQKQPPAAKDSPPQTAPKPADTPPKSLDDRLKITLAADAPAIVTPTGIDVDGRGRVWAIESNTHFRPKGYAGHPTDRLLVFSEMDAAGRFQHVDQFADGFTYAMSVAVRPSGEIFVATRRDVFVFRDADGNLRADGPPKRILQLDTAGDYPHNGLAGFACDAQGWLYIGCGENLGADYKFSGSDGTTLSGGGEGGNIYRCRYDGTRLEHLATGFWNPHASCVDAFGRLFTVDNDPDYRPPCRLLHIVAGGDYGYRYRNGRRGIHPFTAWDGELPGTLPMVAGTGEAPSGVVAYESDGLPEDFIGNLLATSWGDHRIDRFRLKAKGISFTSRAEPVITGGENFRPVGLAVAPDGSLFCTDWVLKDYTLHRHGRIWRIAPVAAASKRGVREAVEPAAVPGRPLAELKDLLHSTRIEVRRAAAGALAADSAGFNDLSALITDPHAPARARLEAWWACKRSPHASGLAEFPSPPAEAVEVAADLSHLLVQRAPAELSVDPAVFANPSAQKLGLETLLAHPDPFVRAIGIRDAAANCSEDDLVAALHVDKTTSATARIGYLLAARRKNPQMAAPVKLGLTDADAAIRRACVQWIGEEHFEAFRPQLEALVGDGAVTADMFEATLASLELLDRVLRKSGDEPSGAQYVLKLLADKSRPAAIRARALSMLPPGQKELDARLLRELLSANDSQLTLETVRTLALSPLPEAPAMLLPVALRNDNDRRLRAEALVGLAAGAHAETDVASSVKRLLLELARGDDKILQIESLRSLRGVADTDANVAQAITQMAEQLKHKSAADAETTRQLADQLALCLPANAESSRGQLQPLESPRPTSVEGWFEVALSAGGDAAAGRRAFFQPNGGRCYLCHMVNGRGGRIGPDLSVVARSMNRRKLAESLLQPSREIAPQFVTWTFVTKSGIVHTGILVQETREGLIMIGTTEGKTLTLPVDQIEERTAQKTSIMPEKLIERMTVGEIRDVLAFLETLK